VPWHFDPVFTYFVVLDPTIRIYCWRTFGAGPMRRKLLEVILHIKSWLPSHPSFFTVLFGITTTYL